jgi:hypothetical protein
MALPKLETPTFELTVPSTGEKIKFRPFLVKEHKVLLTMADADEEQVVRIVKELVDVCTFNKLNIETLAHFDLEYIFMLLRAKSISEIVDVIITCINCDERYDSSFNIEDIKVENLDNKKNNKIMITDKIGVELTFPKFEDIVKLIENSSTDLVIEIVKKNIKGVFDENQYYESANQTQEEIEEFILSLTKEQFEKIEKFFVNSPKLVQTVETECPKCNHHNISKIEGIQNFFV